MPFLEWAKGGPWPGPDPDPEQGEDSSASG
jgi:hypothetical protein